MRQLAWRYFDAKNDVIESCGVHLYTKAGTSDAKYVYKDSQYIYLYIDNFNLDYVGLEVYTRDGILTDEVFIELHQLDQHDANWLTRISRIPSKIRFLLQYVG